MESFPEWLRAIWFGGVFFGILSIGMALDKIIARLDRQNELLGDIRWRVEKRIPD